MTSGNVTSNVTQLQQFLSQHENISAQDFQGILHDAIDIFNRCQPLNTPGSKQGLIYGNVQSGKTAIILTLIAYAIDNGVRNFVVLTSDLNDLYKQTLVRIKQALHSVVVLDKQNFNNASNVGIAVPLIFVATKNTKILDKLFNAIQPLSRRNSTFAIIDDEADQASLDTNLNRPKPKSGVNQEIVNLRNLFTSYTYIQTTATPQALVLQDANTQFRPNFAVVTTPGQNYCGGNYFFGNDNFAASDHLRLVPQIHVTNANTGTTLPQTVVQSLYLFFAGAAALRLAGNNKNYAYLLHTSLKQSAHAIVANLTTAFVNNLMAEFSNNALSNQTLQGLHDAHADLATTFQVLPSVQNIINEIQQCIPSTEVIEINSNTGKGVDPNPNRRHNIYIGANKIGRGVTVKNLLTTYYGRDAQRPQMDTVLQHARMYGYRQAEVPAIRIFLPVHLAQRFYDIHQADNRLRELCISSHAAVPLIRLPKAPGMKPTRANVLNRNTVDLGAYIAGSEYFPSLPLSSPQHLGNQTATLDAMLAPYAVQGQVYVITIDEMLAILNHNFCTPNAPGAWDDVLIRLAITALRNDFQSYNNTANLVIVNRNSNINKAESRNYQSIGSVMPGNVGNPPFGINPNFPAIFLLRLNGNHYDPATNPGGWHGVPFWVPNIRFPNGNYVFSANYT